MVNQLPDSGIKGEVGAMKYALKKIHIKADSFDCITTHCISSQLRVGKKEKSIRDVKRNWHTN